MSCVDLFVNMIVLVFFALIVIFQSLNHGSRELKCSCSLLAAVLFVGPVAYISVSSVRRVVLVFGFYGMSLMNIEELKEQV